VVPGRDVVDQLALERRSNGAEHDRPAEHLGVADFVQLCARHVEQGIATPGLELRDQPSVEVEFRIQVLGRAWEMRHTAAGDDRHSFLPSLDDLGERFAQSFAAARRRQRWNVDVGEERDDGDVALADHILERNRERVTQLGILGVGHVEVVVDDQLVEDVFGELAVNRQIVLASGELRDGAIAGNDRKRRHAADRERFDVVSTEEQNRVRLGLIEHLAELVHRPAGLLELIRILVRRPREHVRRVARPDGGNDLTH
jgi:hypothetical protein